MDELKELLQEAIEDAGGDPQKAIANVRARLAHIGESKALLRVLANRLKGDQFAGVRANPSAALAVVDAELAGLQNGDPAVVDPIIEHYLGMLHPTSKVAAHA